MLAPQPSTTPDIVTTIITATSSEKDISNAISLRQEWYNAIPSVHRRLVGRKTPNELHELLEMGGEIIFVTPPNTDTPSGSFLLVPGTTGIQKFLHVDPDKVPFTKNHHGQLRGAFSNIPAPNTNIQGVKYNARAIRQLDGAVIGTVLFGNPIVIAQMAKISGGLVIGAQYNLDAQQAELIFYRPPQGVPLPNTIETKTGIAITTENLNTIQNALSQHGYIGQIERGAQSMTITYHTTTDDLSFAA